MTDRPASFRFIALRSDELVANAAAALAPTAQSASSCTACGLAKARNTVVFGSGTARSGIVMIGEAPGANEDAVGLPFVGRSGRLLDELFAFAGIARDDVYICNVVKCRPPDNRTPKPLEAAACAPFLRRQLQVLQPLVICALGLSAARWIAPSKLPMRELRGRTLDYMGIAVIVTYHPAAILRNPLLRHKSEEDFARLRSVTDAAGPRRNDA